MRYWLHSVLHHAITHPLVALSGDALWAWHLHEWSAKAWNAYAVAQGLQEPHPMQAPGRSLLPRPGGEQ